MAYAQRISGKRAIRNRPSFTLAAHAAAVYGRRLRVVPQVVRSAQNLGNPTGRQPLPNTMIYSPRGMRAGLGGVGSLRRFESTVRFIPYIRRYILTPTTLSVASPSLISRSSEENDVTSSDAFFRKVLSPEDFKPILVQPFEINGLVRMTAVHGRSIPVVVVTGPFTGGPLSPLRAPRASTMWSSV